MHRYLFAVFTALTLCCAAPAAENNLLLKAATPEGFPANRKVPEGASARVTDGKLNVSFTRPGSLIYTVYLPADCLQLELSGILESTDLTPGKESWQNGRLAMRFLDGAGKQTGDWPDVLFVSGTSGAKPGNKIYTVPPGAVMLLFEPAHFGTTGKVEFRDLAIRPSTQNLLIAPAPGGVPAKGFAQKTVTATIDSGKLNVMIDGPGNYRLNIPVDPAWKSLKVSTRWKLTGVQQGDQGWKNARIAMRFYQGNEGTGAWPEPLNGSGTRDWEEFSRIYEIPEGATHLAFEPANFGTAGKAEFENLSLTLHEMR